MSSRESRGDVQRWLRFAREDLNAAEAMLAKEDCIPRHVCWLAQQAGEKALKGALVAAEIHFPYRHDLDALRNLLPDDWNVKRDCPDLAELTEWAVEARYPGDWADPTLDDARRAARQARTLYESVIADLSRHGIDTGKGGNQ